MNENAAVEGDSPGLRDIGEVWVVPDPEDQNQIQPLDSGVGSATGVSWKT